MKGESARRFSAAYTNIITKPFETFTCYRWIYFLGGDHPSKRFICRGACLSGEATPRGLLKIKSMDYNFIISSIDIQIASPINLNGTPICVELNVDYMDTEEYDDSFYLSLCDHYEVPRGCPFESLIKLEELDEFRRVVALTALRNET